VPSTSALPSASAFVRDPSVAQHQQREVQAQPLSQPLPLTQPDVLQQQHQLSVEQDRMPQSVHEQLQPLQLPPQTAPQQMPLAPTTFAPAATAAGPLPSMEQVSHEQLQDQSLSHGDDGGDSDSKDSEADSDADASDDDE